MRKGKIIYLNGISSSGKSTIAKELHPLLNEPFLYTGIDMFIWMLQDRYWNQEPEGFIVIKNNTGAHIVGGSVATNLEIGMCRTIAALAESGNNVLVDDVIFSHDSLKKRVVFLAGYQVWFVGVHCPLEVAEQRELDRADRVIGLAKAQYSLVHQPGVYDIEVDTSVLSPGECAERIISNLKSEPTSFHKLKDILQI